MLRRVINNLGIFVGLTLIIVIIHISLTSYWEVNASDSDMAALLTELNSHIVEEAGGELTIHFDSPIAGIVSTIDIPTEVVNGNPLYSIVDIGEDYMCYQDNTGEVFFVFCTPYENITSIAYTELP
jgi:hypothetical protein